MEHNKRKHMSSIINTQFEDQTTGVTCNLSNNFYVKKILGKAKYFRKFDNFYHEIPKACVRCTIKNSRTLDTSEMKKNLRRFNAQKNR